MISSYHDPDCHLPLKSTCSLWGKGRRDFTNNTQKGRNLQYQTPTACWTLTRAYETTPLPTIPRAQPGPWHLSQHPDTCHNARATTGTAVYKHSQPGLRSALLFSHQKTIQTFCKSQGPVCLGEPPLQCPNLPKTGLTTLLSMFSTQLLSLAPKAFKPVLCIWLAGFTGTCFGQSLPMIITCQLSPENCKGESEMQLQAFTWWAGIVFCVPEGRGLGTAATTDTADR